MPAGIAAPILSILASLVSALLRRGPRPSRRRQLELDVHAARSAAASGDDAAVNAVLERQRVSSRVSGRVRKAARAVALAAALGCASCAPSGCGMLRPETDYRARPDVVVVPSDLRVVPITHEGIKGYFVPRARMALLVEDGLLQISELDRKE